MEKIMKKQIISLTIAISSIAHAAQQVKPLTSLGTANEIHGQIKGSSSSSQQRHVVSKISPKEIERMKELWLGFSFLNVFSKLYTIVINHIEENQDLNNPLKEFKNEVHASLERLPFFNVVKHLMGEELATREDIVNSGYGILFGLSQLAETLQREPQKPLQQNEMDHIRSIFGNILAHTSHITTQAHNHMTSTSATHPSPTIEHSELKHPAARTIQPTAKKATTMAKTESVKREQRSTTASASIAKK